MIPVKVFWERKNYRDKKKNRDDRDFTAGRGGHIG